MAPYLFYFTTMGKRCPLYLQGFFSILFYNEEKFVAFEPAKDTEPIPVALNGSESPFSFG